MSCAFCGMPPRDGEPCCGSEYRRKVMRDADRKIQEQRGRISALETDLAFYKDREQHFASVLNVCDAGRYRNDWDAALRRTVERASALEGLLRECRVHVQYAEHTIGCQARYGEKTCACGIFGLLSRLDAALTHDRKEQDGR